MKRTLLAFLAVAACARPQYRSPNSEVVLTVEGKVEGSPVELDADALRALEQRTVRGRAPGSTDAVAYEGASLLALIRELEPKRGVDLAIVHGSGGYAVAIPLPAIRQYRPVIAQRAGGRPVAEAIGEAAGRFVLAWPNVEAPGFDIDLRTRWWWARDVRRIELVSWFATYGRALRVPSGASDDARRGADRFAASCINCHRLRDVGGKRGPDLSSWLAPGDRERFVEAVRAHSKIPGMQDADLARGLPETMAFLEAVHEAGPLPPGDEYGPERPEEDQKPDEGEQKPGEELPPTLPPAGPTQGARSPRCSPPARRPARRSASPPAGRRAQRPNAGSPRGTPRG